MQSIKSVHDSYCMHMLIGFSLYILPVKWKLFVYLFNKKYADPTTLTHIVTA